jgi:glucose/arabinose dehydrogenase
MRRPLSTASAVLLTALVLTACTPTAAAPTTPSAAATESSAATPAATPTDTPDAGTAEPTCETIILSSTAADFRSIGWKAQSEPFRVGATEVAGGILCKWSDGSATAAGVQMFGWAPIDATTADKAERDLVASGWKREDGANGDVYVTENPDWLGGRGVDGYGITYLFGDGFVKVADTKQSLVLIDWPPSQR